MIESICFSISAVDSSGLTEVITHGMVTKGAVSIPNAFAVATVSFWKPAEAIETVGRPFLSR